jgi:leader peptidase (prepilin peptidase)/N-methyltransferase
LGTIDTMTILYSVLMFLFGITFASFCHVVAFRVPKGESIGGRSHCPACDHELRFIDVFPLLGYFINRGRCHFCRAKIPFLHVLVELTGGILFTASYLFAGFTLELPVLLVMVCVLLTESITDFGQMVVLDRIWIIGLVPLVVIRLIQGTFFPHLLSSAVLFGTMFLFGLLGKLVFKKEALGGGDIKLYAFLGFCLTIWNGLLSLFFAALAGSVFGLLARYKSGRVMALVPFIFFGVLVAYFFGDIIIAWYLNLLGM